MPLVFTVTNTGRVSVTLPIQGRNPTADFRIADRDGHPVWSRLHGQTLLAILGLFPLDVGKSLTFRHVWNQRADGGTPIPPGEYLAHGVLLTDDPEGLVSPPARMTIG